MKRLILAALAVVVTLPAAISTQAQDDVYYSRKNSRKQPMTIGTLTPTTVGRLRSTLLPK